jgi:hypothetical protein
MRTHLSILFLLASAGCNEVTTFTDAGGDDDTTVDGSTVDAPAAGTVTVITRTRYPDLDAPLANVPVIAVAPDGTLRDSGVSDATGTATLDVIAGDSVTAIYPVGTNGNQDLLTTLAVEPGDTLTYGAYILDFTDTGGLAVTWPPATDISAWYLYTDCSSAYGGSGTTLAGEVQRYANCTNDTTDVMIVGHATGDGQPSVWAKLEDVAWASGAATFTTYQNAPTVTIAASGIPPEISYFELSPYGTMGRVQVSSSVYVYASPPTDGALSGSGRVAVGNGGYGHWYASRNANGLSQQEGNIGMTSATELRLDDPALIPFVTRPQINAAARQALWIQTDGAPYDVAYFTMSYSNLPPSFVPGIGGAQYYSWTIIVPPGVTSLELPALPGYEEYLPIESAFISGDVMLVEDERYDGYRGARNMPEWDLACSYSCVPADLTAPRRTWSRYGGD